MCIVFIPIYAPMVEYMISLQIIIVFFFFNYKILPCINFIFVFITKESIKELVNIIIQNICLI